MTDFFLMFSELMPFDDLAEMVHEAMKNYRNERSPDNKRQLTMLCALLATKESMNGRSAIDVSKELEETKRIKERLQSEKM